MTKICDQMNMRNRMARYASRASSDYHTYQFFKDRDAPEKAIITQIDGESATLMLIKYGLESKFTLS
jgi:exosome complex exonuclease DIS3/RRP44